MDTFLLITPRSSSISTILSFITTRAKFYLPSLIQQYALLYIFCLIYRYLLCADYEAYLKAQDRVNELYLVLLPH